MYRELTNYIQYYNRSRFHFKKVIWTSDADGNDVYVNWAGQAL